MTRSFAIAWAVVATFTLYLSNASGQPAKAEPAKAAPAAKPEAAKPAAKPEAAKPEAAKPPEMPPKPGEETKKLQFLAGTMNGTGKVEKGAMGPDSPEMTSKAKHSCKWMLGNLWLACDISDTAGTGKTAMTWMGHMMVGYDMQEKKYRAVGVDNMGMAFDLNGTMSENKFVMESERESMMMGTPVKARFTFDTTDPKAIKFTEERSMKGGPWMLAETVTFKKGG
jgi:Protein of unknown function (DUF1579)